MKKRPLKFCVISLFLSFVLSLGMAPTSIAQVICDKDIGSHGGFTYEYWKDYGGGCMTLNNGGNFYIDWYNIGNLLARKGLRPGVKNQTVTYGANYQPNGNSYLCVYGWTRSPLIEYYIVESWGDWRPPGATSVGTVTSDGGTYDLYRTYRHQQPSIDGDMTNFYQYWSVRTSKRTSGTVTCENHFNAWENQGWTLGNLFEVSFTVEGYQSSGTCDVYSMSMGTSTSSIPNGTYSMKARSGVYLTTAGSVQPLKSRNSQNGNDTKFDFTHLGNNVYEIKSKRWAQRLEIPYGRTGSGEKVAITNWNGNGDNLKWKAEKTVIGGNTYFRFLPMHDQARAMDAYQGNPNVVHLWNKSWSNNNQLFQLIQSNGSALRQAPEETELSADPFNAVSVFPNPATDRLFIHGLNQGNYELQILDIQGRVYQTAIVEINDTHQVDLSDFPTGMYLLTLKDEQELKTIKFTKTN